MACPSSYLTTLARELEIGRLPRVYRKDSRKARYWLELEPGGELQPLGRSVEECEKKLRDRSDL